MNDLEEKQFAEMRTKIQDLEKANDDLSRENLDYQNSADEAEEARDVAVDREEVATAALKMVYGRTLAVLRALEFDKSGLCPMCRFDWYEVGLNSPKHAIGCDLKLEIYRLDMDLSRAQYA